MVFSVLLVLVGLQPSAKPTRPILAIISAEDEYQTEKTVPAFAKAHLPGWTSKLITADPANKHHLPDLKQIQSADVILLSMRRRPLLDADLKIIRDAIAAKTPLVAIRTSSHAFAPKKGETIPKGVVAWEKFDQEILGCHYTGHYSNKLTTTVTRPASANDHAVLKGLGRDPFISPCWLYKSNPLAADCQILLAGTVGENAPEPVAWVREKSEKRGRVFYTCLGTPSDFELKEFTTMLTNAVEWARQGK